MSLLKSPAKINLFLNIIKKRKDSYHNIETYFQLISLYDYISLNVIDGTKIKITSNQESLANQDNICVKATELFQKETGIKLNVSIDLIKNIPLGGGLGGGSSNAATILLGLNDLWKCNLSKKRLLDLGEKLGSDVPLFINGYSAFGEGTGMSLTNAKYFIKKQYILIVNPGIHVSSKIMYSKYAINDCIKCINLDNMHHHIGFNSFENLLCTQYPEIEVLLNMLRGQGNGAVSGSGSCIFSVFEDENKAKYVSELVPKKYQTYIVHSLDKI